jgi:hypothetical protein
MKAFRFPSIRPSTAFSAITRLEVRCTCCCCHYPRARFMSSGRPGATAVTKSTSTLAAENPRSTGSPTLRDKIHSRAGNIAGHLRSNSYTTTTTSQHNLDQISTMASQYSARRIGAPNTLEHRIFIEENGKPVSPFHDIPLYANQEQTILNMIVEVPRWTNAKMEVSSLLRWHHCWCNNIAGLIPIHLIENYVNHIRLL